MRSFFLWLLLCWVTGIALAQWSGWRMVAIAGVLLVALAWRWSVTMPLAVAGLSLLGLGSLYGQPAPINTTTCVIELPHDFTVITARLFPDRATYVVADTNNCRASVSAARFPAYAAGDTVHIAKGKIADLAEITNEGYAAYLRRQGISATMQYPTIHRLSNDTPQLPVAARVEHLVNRAFLEPDAGVAAALLLARTDGLSATLQENFRATGLSHLLAISGMNITLLAGILIGLFQLLPLSPLSRTLCISLLLWGYMALLGWPVSAVRATFFWTIALLAFRLRVLTSLPAVLLLTLLGMLSLRPVLAADISFQLSVAAVVGIFFMHFLTQRYVRALPGALKVLAASLLVTLGATITTWPIIAYHFGTISLISVPANIVVAPVVGIQMVVAMLTLFLAMVFPAGALVPAYIFHLTVRWMDVVSGAMAQIGGVYLQNVVISSALLTGYYLTVVAISYGWLRYQRRSWREVWQ